MIRRFQILFFVLVIGSTSGSAQGFLHAEGKKIVDGKGENFLIRSIGTGNWMLQEGYMMETAGIAGTQHEFRNKLIQSMGEARTDTFYNSWLENHYTRTDVDSMASWGFNAVRVALHYKWFTLPIEEEPVYGTQTWLKKGFDLMDSLVVWCSDNQIYVILDMHGAPGGQGKNADISDYDPTKPSLWESEQNKAKLVALWYELAKRYSDEEWVGGYDLINETNWEFPEGNNYQLRSIYQRLTDTIRLVDQNHMLIIEGNGFANDFSGLTPPWDANFVYSFHKYWSYNSENSLDWVISLRDQYNVPLWLGESGENSNTWFTNLISLAEKKNIGWSWWPVKKGWINCPLQVTVNSDYRRMVDYWRGNGDALNADETFAAVMKFSENHRIENCNIQYGVIDAMIRQPFTTEIKPHADHHTEDYIFSSEYDIGRNNHAYFDWDTADYHLDTGTYQKWNEGGVFRNDGVDIELCNDTDTTNGYNIGWTKNGEWMIYTLHNDSAVLADGIIRTSCKNTGAYAILEADGKIISENIYLPATGSFSAWRSNAFQNVILPAGKIKLKVKFLKGGANFNYLKFNNFRSPNLAAFKALYCETSKLDNQILIHLNRESSASELDIGEFVLKINNKETSIITANISESEPGIIKIQPGAVMEPGHSISISYTGSSIAYQDQLLENFIDKTVDNQQTMFYIPPSRIQAEDYYRNKGMQIEKCEDDGNGFNTGYAHKGDYLDYLVYIPGNGVYRLDLRVALQNGNAEVSFSYLTANDTVNLKNLTLLNTGGWQVWETQSTSVSLPKGKYVFRINMEGGENNMNWLELSPLHTSVSKPVREKLRIYPNPAGSQVTMEFMEPTSDPRLLEIFDNRGVMVFTKKTSKRLNSIDTEQFKNGIYLVRVISKDCLITHKLMIN